jgi:hypothetical protein
MSWAETAIYKTLKILFDDNMIFTFHGGGMFLLDNMNVLLSYKSMSFCVNRLWGP